MAEFLTRNRRNLLAAGALAGSLLLGACAGEEGAVTVLPDDALIEQVEAVGVASQSEGSNAANSVLLSDGRRVTFLDTTARIERCEDTTLVTVTRETATTESVENHAWCTDGTLTEADLLPRN